MGRLMDPRTSRRYARWRWSRARTLDDIADLTGQWLTGSLAATPECGCSPDAETLPYSRLLARVNHRGLITVNSSADPRDGPAWVQGFARHGTPMSMLATLSASIGPDITPMNRRERREILSWYAYWCHQDAMAALEACSAITITTQPGAQLGALWDMLRIFSGEAVRDEAVELGRRHRGWAVCTEEQEC